MNAPFLPPAPANENLSAEDVKVNFNAAIRIHYVLTEPHKVLAIQIFDALIYQVTPEINPNWVGSWAFDVIREGRHNTHGSGYTQEFCKTAQDACKLALRRYLGHCIDGLLEQDDLTQVWAKIAKAYAESS